MLCLWNEEVTVCITVCTLAGSLVLQCECDVGVGDVHLIIFEVSELPCTFVSSLWHFSKLVVIQF